VLLAGTTLLFLGVLFCDITYALSYEVQWKNFASWLLVGALLLVGVTLLWAFIGFFRPDKRGRRHAVYFLLLLTAWVLGFINALVHAEDAWSSMPEALILSAIVAALATLAIPLGFSTVRAGGLP
jgi:uncharacterized membrane protein